MAGWRRHADAIWSPNALPEDYMGRQATEIEGVEDERWL